MDKAVILLSRFSLLARLSRRCRNSNTVSGLWWREVQRHCGRLSKLSINLESASVLR